MKTRLKRFARRFKGRIIDTMLNGASNMRIGHSRILRPQPHAPAQLRRILVVDEMLPDPRFGAGYPRAAEILYALIDAGWDVTMYPISASRAEQTIISGRFSNYPIRFVQSHGLNGLRRLMRENLDSFEVTIISRPDTMQIYSSIRARLPQFRTYCVYDAEAIFAARELKRLELFGRPMSEEAYEQALNREIALVAEADAITTVTEAEATLFRARSAKPVFVIKHSIAIRSDSSGFNGRADMLFVGRCTGDREYSPNVDSLHWFVHEVMPLIDAALTTDYRLVVVGLADSAIVSALTSDRIVFLGVVDDLDAVYDRCRVFVAPTRFSAGIPLKVVEAAAAGIPCVVTSLLAEQLGFQDDVELMAARDAGEFARACVALYKQPDRWLRLRNAARHSVRDDYSRATFGAAVQKAVATPNSR